MKKEQPPTFNLPQAETRSIRGAAASHNVSGDQNDAL